MSDLDRSMHRSLWFQVAHSSFIEGSHMTKNMASESFIRMAPDVNLVSRMNPVGRIEFVLDGFVPF